MKEIQNNQPADEHIPPLPEDDSPTIPTAVKKKDPLYKWVMFGNLMTIPALSFYFYFGLNGKINGYFILLILMLVAEYLTMRRYYNNQNK